MEVGVEVSSDALWRQVKKRGGVLLAEVSPKEYTAPVQDIGAYQESEVSPLYVTEGAEDKYPQREI